MSGLFKGLAEQHRSRLTSNNNFLGEGEVFIAQVLDVVKNGRPAGELTTEDVPNAIGTIRFNKANVKKRPEKEVLLVAEPLDRSNYRLPLIGEQVLVVHKNTRYYYFSVVSSVTNMMVSIDPDLLEDPYQASGPPRVAVDPDTERTRFINRNDYNLDTIKKSTALFSKVREADTILEGRMGGVIKLTQTITKEGVWDPEKQITNIGLSADGDPMLLMKSNIRTKNLSDMGFLPNNLEDDDVNADASSFYLTTTQNIPLELASSSTMYSWSVTVQAATTKTKADESTQLSKFFPEQYDPNDPLRVEIGATITGTGFGFGGGAPGPVDGTNGKLPDSALMPVGLGSHKLEPEAATAFIRMVEAARAQGLNPAITDSYRPFSVQDRIFDWDLYVATGGNRTDTAANYNRNALKKKIGTNGKTSAAFPGTSNHGWGRAIDASGDAWKKFIRNRGVEFGWSWYEGRACGEDWHFTYDPSKKQTWPVA